MGMGALLRPGRERGLSAASGRREEGQASGANNAIRELGGVFGVAVLAVDLRPATAATSSRQSFADGLVPAVWVGAIVVGLGAVAALTIPRRRRARVEAIEPAPALEEAA